MYLPLANLLRENIRISLSNVEVLILPCPPFPRPLLSAARRRAAGAAAASGHRAVYAGEGLGPARAVRECGGDAQRCGRPGGAIGALLVNCWAIAQGLAARRWSKAARGWSKAARDWSSAARDWSSAARGWPIAARGW